MRNALATLTILLLIVSSSGCSALKDPPENSASIGTTDSTEVKLTFIANIVGEQAVVLAAAVEEFSRQTGYEVEFSSPGKSYEELMKTKMFSKKLPDLFTTHGWSVSRYSKFLTAVNDRPFADYIAAQIKPYVTGADGEIYVLPIDQDIAGIVYNIDVLNDAGVNVDDICTWDDFSGACDKIKKKGYIPIHIGAMDNWSAGNLFDWIAPSFYITDERSNRRNELKSGRFDRLIWEELALMIDGWRIDGYFNEDLLMADYESDVRALAENKAAFCFYSNSAIIDAKTVNSSAQLGVMPVPAKNADDAPTFIIGERIAIGVWNESPYKKEAFELLDYLASPEVAGRIVASTGNPSGLTYVSGNSDFDAYYDKYKDIRVFPYFDREYLPSGMWDWIIDTGIDILSGKPNAVSNAGRIMEQNFYDKLSDEVER